MKMIIIILQKPTFPTTKGIRKNKITPKILYSTGQKTPMKVPYFDVLPLLPFCYVYGISSESESDTTPPWIHRSLSTDASGVIGIYYTSMLSIFFFSEFSSKSDPGPPLSSRSSMNLITFSLIVKFIHWMILINRIDFRHFINVVLKIMRNIWY